jgi:hypothetical protein
MSFEEERSVFTAQPHEFLLPQVSFTINELQPGMIGYMDGNDVGVVEIVDENGEVKFIPHVDRYAPMIDRDTVVQRMVSETATKGRVREYIRVVMLNEGPMIDSSHLEATNWQLEANRFTRRLTHEYLARPESFVPIIDWLFNSDELEIKFFALADQNIDLDPDDFNDMIDEARLILKSLNNAESLEEDDEDDDDGEHLKAKDQ